MAKAYDYIIVGAGLAGAGAVDGIRQVDTEGSILMVGIEGVLPYDRPPLSKDLWFGKKQEAEVFPHDAAYYIENRVEVLLQTRVEEVDPEVQLIEDHNGEAFSYGKLLLATGGTPRTLDIPGGDFEAICYYRTLDDYQRIRAQAAAGKSAVVVGGGFIGSEIAAALCSVGVEVTMIYPGSGLVPRIFPKDLSLSLEEAYRGRGIKIVRGDAPAKFEHADPKWVVTTKAGASIAADMVIAGVGILPDEELAALAGLDVDNGVVVNEFLQTSNPHIYAAGDNAQFPYTVLGDMMRVEHWDNALKQGQAAGKNMALPEGAQEAYTYMPYFFSDLFEFGFEAVGDVDARLDTFCDWQEEHKTGVIYYLRDQKVRGVMLCNVWKKRKAARELISSGRQLTESELKGAIQ